MRASSREVRWINALDVLVDALLSRRLLEAIFSPDSPIKGGSIVFEI
mgnify:CR=1 FL=1